MATKIRLYPLPIATSVEIKLPEDAIILKVSESSTRGDPLNLWAIVDTDNPVESCTFFVLTTDEEVPEPVRRGYAVYLDTVTYSSHGTSNAALVYHVFQEIDFN